MTDLALTARLDSDGAVEIVGPKGTVTIGKGDPPHKFKFTLEDETGLNVSFASLDAKNHLSTCPPPSGATSDQIEDIKIENGKTPKEASFKDKNKDPMDICYRWNFTCDDRSQTNINFDPIIKNGGN